MTVILLIQLPPIMVAFGDKKIWVTGLLLLGLQLFPFRGEYQRPYVTNCGELLSLIISNYQKINITQKIRIMDNKLIEEMFIENITHFILFHNAENKACPYDQYMKYICIM